MVPIGCSAVELTRGADWIFCGIFFSADSDELRTLVACSGAVPLLRQGLSSAFAGLF